MVYASLEEWLESRPACVRELAKEFPLNSTIRVGDRTFYLLGYTEEDQLVLSTINPHEDYDGAMAAKEYLCADHVRRGQAVLNK